MDIIQKSDFYDDIFYTSKILVKSLKATCDTTINKKICILSFNGNDILNIVNVTYLLGLHLTILNTDNKRGIKYKGFILTCFELKVPIVATKKNNPPIH